MDSPGSNGKDQGQRPVPANGTRKRQMPFFPSTNFQLRKPNTSTNGRGRKSGSGWTSGYGKPPTGRIHPIRSAHP
jgi:hypothetical protein